MAEPQGEMNMETSMQYNDFLEKLLIDELIKEFDFNCKLVFSHKKRFGGSNLTTYYFKDELGIVWERDVPDRQWFSIALRHPNMRPRLIN